MGKGSFQHNGDARKKQHEYCRKVAILQEPMRTKTSSVSRRWTLPPQIVFAAANPQSLLYQNLPEDYILSVNKNGWTKNEPGDWMAPKIYMNQIQLCEPLESIAY